MTNANQATESEALRQLAFEYQTFNVGRSLIVHAD